jgi:hypothetical protein
MDAERARATLAASLVNSWERGAADIEDKLETCLRESAWRPDMPNHDITTFVARWNRKAFAYSSSDVEVRDTDVKRLARVWQSAYDTVLREIPGAVIRVGTHRPEDVAPLAELAVRAGADIAVHADSAAPRATWSWPLRIGVAEGDPIVDEVRGTYPELCDVVDVRDTADVEVDVLIVSDDDVRDRIVRNNVRAGVVVAHGTDAASAFIIRDEFHSFATLFVPDMSQRGWWRDVLTELAHDAPLDVAVRRIPGAVLVSAGDALSLTAIRTYAAMLLGEETGLWVERPAATAPEQLAGILANVPFGHESAGATLVAGALRSTGTSLPVTIVFPMAGPPPPEPPEHAWPRIDAPDAVAAGATFKATVGLGIDPDPAVQAVMAGELPAADDVLVKVVADGFELVDGEFEFTVNLAGTATQDITLRAVDDVTLRAERTIGVRYTVGGALRAYAMRNILVTGATPAPPGIVETPPPGAMTQVPIADADVAPPTLVLTLQQGSDLAGLVWQWTITSDTLQLATVPDEELRTTLDETARTQANLVREGSRSTGIMLYDRMVGIGRRLADKLPDAVIDALRAAAKATDPEPPSILLISSEARIPWELAVIEPSVRAVDSPFLCGQVHLGRWVVGSRGRPGSPPNRVKPVKSRGVVVGDYTGLLKWRPLPEANTEAAELVAAGAQKLSAEDQPVRDAVNGTPPFDVLHFATHGRFEEGQREDGLVLVDRSGDQPQEVYLTPGDVEGGELPNGPFVFLNACQVGAAETILGDYAGMAAAFLRIGATAVVAPLWEVADSIAAETARDFYAAIDAGTTVGAAVSALRGKFTRVAAKTPATANFGSYLAYQYFGHPNLILPKEQ